MAFGATDEELYTGGENERYLKFGISYSQNSTIIQIIHTHHYQSKTSILVWGLERMVSVVQDVPTNFDTDLFMPIIEKTEEFANRKYKRPGEVDLKEIFGSAEDINTPFKVIADHIRTVAFAIGDGALPSNEGRGYVLRDYFVEQYALQNNLVSTNHLCTNLFQLSVKLCKTSIQK